MKKLWLLMIFCVLLTGCSSKSANTTTAADDNKIDSVTAIGNNQTEMTISVGMPYDDVFAACSDNIFDPYHYAFLKAQNGQTILVTFRYIAKQHRIYRIEVFDAREHLPSAEEFNQIERGMTISEVTALVGFPYKIPEMSGFHAYSYLLDDGTVRGISWNLTSVKMTVLSY